MFSGGFSTFLAFAPLVLAVSPIFHIFFKVFFLVVAFGQYHGLVVLPVVLSLLGPGPAQSLHDEVSPAQSPPPAAAARADSLQGQISPPKAALGPAEVQSSSGRSSPVVVTPPTKMQEPDIWQREPELEGRQAPGGGEAGEGGGGGDQERGRY